MDHRLLARYREYASTEEAYAVLFVKMHLAQAKAHWVDIVDFRRYEMSPDNLHFRFVVGGLYKKDTSAVPAEVRVHDQWPI